MRCFHPLQGFLPAGGGRLKFGWMSGEDGREVEVRCGQCIGCRLKRSRDWATRMVHESRMHDHSCFITLTYDNAHLPHDGSLRYSDFQLFMKKFRSALHEQRSRLDLKQSSVSSQGGTRAVPPRNLRFFMCGEYGELTSRPHYHAILFGVDFADRVFLKSLSSGFQLDTSASLSSLWTLGFASVGDFSFESAAYVARYVTKKVTGDQAETHYRRLDPETGEVYQVRPEFCRMSLKPGIGFTWWERFRKESNKDYVVVDGEKMTMPRYYDKLLEALPDFRSDDFKFDRAAKAVEFQADNTPDRLRAQEVVAKARLSFKKRSLE